MLYLFFRGRIQEEEVLFFPDHFLCAQGISEQAHEELVQYPSSLRALHHSQREETTWYVTNLTIIFYVLLTPQSKAIDY